MLALTLSIGILVDDSIVVIENISRHLAKGQPPIPAAISGRNEIGLAAITITLVDVVVYVPIALISGIGGQILRPFALVIASAMLTSRQVVSASRKYPKVSHVFALTGSSGGASGAYKCARSQRG